MYKGGRTLASRSFIVTVSALELSITVEFFPPHFVCCARTPYRRPEVPCSPTMRKLFASLSTQ
jgi:hypothetical protein